MRLDLNDKEKAKLIFLGFEPGAFLRTNLLQVFEENADIFDVVDCEPKAYLEITQSRLGVMNKKLRRKAKEFKPGEESVNLDKKKFSKSELEILEKLACAARDFLLSDFETPRPAVEDEYPNFWALVALLFDEGRFSFDKKDTWKRLQGVGNLLKLHRDGAWRL